MVEETEEKQPIDWDNPEIPIQFYALRREVIRLNILVEALMKSRKKSLPLEEMDKPGSDLRANTWKDILERHRQAIEPQDS
ncbi:MAG: hypothetical protein Q7R34_03930 [Dehalococcoidia bacterium]|nr:hypothetical protein [Dehalococcoidia bacterium]